MAKRQLRCGALLLMAAVTGSALAEDRAKATVPPSLQGVSATPLTKVSTPEKLDPKWKTELCDLTHADCSAQCADGVDWNVALYRSASDPADRFYAILPGPVIAHLQFAGTGHWTRLDAWSFVDYQPSERVTGDGAVTSCIGIFPALYPVGPNRQAVAVTLPWQESYSGGGGNWELADFVEITSGGMQRRVISGMPFSCEKSIRACFDERDYRSDHCSDDSDGHLTLRWAQAKADAYDWIATWHESVWPGQVSKSKTEKSQHSEVLLAATMPNATGRALMKAIKFCEPTAYCGPDGCEGDK